MTAACASDNTALVHVATVASPLIKTATLAADASSVVIISSVSGTVTEKVRSYAFAEDGVVLSDGTKQGA